MLGELLSLSAAERRVRIAHRDVTDALLALGTEDGISWLESALDSPVVSQWGQALYTLNPSWDHLDRWVRRSKEHALAAIDALLDFGPRATSLERESPRLPEGADNEKIHTLIDEALRRYDNPRLRMAEKQIRHLWPVGELPRRTVEIPDVIGRAADVMFRSRSAWRKEWIAEMESSLDPPDDAMGIWHTLVTFCDDNDLLVWLDWKAEPTDIVGRLRKIPSARDVAVPWLLYERFDGTIEELCMAMGEEIRQCGHVLVEMDTGGDDLALAIVPADTVEIFRSVAESCFGIPMDSRDSEAADRGWHWHVW